MAKPWFHRRQSHEGTGYSIASPQGLFVLVIFVALTVAMVLGGVYVATQGHVPVIEAVLGSMAGFVILLIGFIALIMRTSD